VYVADWVSNLLLTEYAQHTDVFPQRHKGAAVRLLTEHTGSIENCPLFYLFFWSFTVCAAIELLRRWYLARMTSVRRAFIVQEVCQAICSVMARNETIAHRLRDSSGKPAERKRSSLQRIARTTAEEATPADSPETRSTPVFAGY
jgi:hypothetical protein